MQVFGVRHVMSRTFFDEHSVPLSGGAGSSTVEGREELAERSVRQVAQLPQNSKQVPQFSELRTKFCDFDCSRHQCLHHRMHTLCLSMLFTSNQGKKTGSVLLHSVNVILSP
jgi:hypothetical protein